ncbi:hypothetical protein [Halomarina rubra]|uniref:Outer membrane lipoprotein-sorting protein n=1 Tax=Halomarina rubra TaxID=2071873 RepID=A0ABD6AQ00_9EURY|nr:hypothetical protein [Halomarina rubra]
MTRPRATSWLCAAVCLLLVCSTLAGCGTSDREGRPTSERTVTPAPVPDAPARLDGELLPGVTREGVADPLRLVDAHVSTLAGTTYTVRRTERRTTPSGTVRSRFDHTIRVGEAGRSHYVLDIQRRTDGDLDRRRIERWVGEGRAVVAETAGNRTVYRPLDSSPATLTDIATNRQGFVRLFSYLDLRVTERVERAGVTHYRLAVSGGTQTLSPLRDVAFVAWVSERGVVREYRLSYLAPTDEGVVRVTVNGSISHLGVTTAPTPPEGVLSTPTPTGTGDPTERSPTVAQSRSASTGRSLAAVHAG